MAKKEDNVGIQLAPPWIEYSRKVTALFGKDPEVNVVWSEDTKVLKLYVTSAEKAEAIASLLPAEKVFGNVKVKTEVVPANDQEPTLTDIYRTAFKGNPAVSYMEQKGALNQFFVVFQPEVVQYFNDNLGDINGLRSSLYETLANEVFENRQNIYFCTELVPA